MNEPKKVKAVCPPMRSPGPAIGLGAQWTQGYLRNQDRWDEFVEAQCPGAGLIKWGLHGRVYLYKDRIIKASIIGVSPDEGESHSLRSEFEMNEVCEGKLWELHPVFREKPGKWELLMLDHLSGHTMNRLIEMNQAGKVRLFSLINALLYLSWKGLSYKQLRGRHMFVGSDRRPIFIDFGGSKWGTRWGAFWNNLAPIKREKGKWHISRFGYLAACILRQSLKRSPRYSESCEVAPSERSFESSDESFVLEQMRKNREDLKREPVKGGLSACTLYCAWKQSVVDWAGAFPEQICDVFRWEFNEGTIIWGGDSWGVIWDEIRRKIEFRGKRVLEYGGSMGLGPVHARLAGAESVVSLADGDVAQRVGRNATAFFGVDQVEFRTIAAGNLERPAASADIGLALSLSANEADWPKVRDALAGCVLVIRRTRQGLEFLQADLKSTDHG